MTITYPLSLPTNKNVASITMRPIEAVGITISEFSGARTAQKNPKQLWVADLSLSRMSRADGAEWDAFFLSLSGRFGTFLLGETGKETPRGSASSAPGTPLVNGGGQTGNSLVMDGAPNNATGYLLKGDYIQLGTGTSTRMYQVLEDANSDGSGNVTLTIWPNLRTSPATNDPITISNCKGTFMLASNEMNWSTNHNEIYMPRSFTAVEAL